MRLDELRNGLSDLASDLTTHDGDPVALVGHRVRRARQRTMAASAVAAIALVVLVAWLARPDHPRSEVNIGPGPAPSPSVTATTVYPPGEYTVDARLVDLNNGWIITDLRLLHSTDAGSTWTSTALPWNEREFESSGPVTAIVDAQHAWVAIIDRTTHRVRVVSTSDGGRTLQSSEFEAGTPSSVSLSFIDPTHGFAAVASDPASSTAALFATADGGQTWQRVTDQAPSRGVWFSSGTFGFASGEGLFSTTDGGASWFRLHPPGWDDVGVVPGGPLYRVVWNDGDRSIVEARVPTGMLVGIRYLETRDAGATWRDITPPDLGAISGTGPQPALGVISPGRLRVLRPNTGDDPNAHLFSSDDDGATWSTTTTNISLSAHSLSFVTPDLVWANAADTCSSGSCTPALAWRSTNGGVTWSPLQPPQGIDQTRPLSTTFTPGPVATRASVASASPAPDAFTQVSDIRFVTPSDGWAVGQPCPGCQTPIDATHDGGATWQRINSPLAAAGASSSFALRVGANGNLWLFSKSDTGNAVGGVLFHSSDAGTTWEQITGFYRVADLAVEPNGVWLIAQQCDPSRATPSCVSALVQSTDNGASWSVAPSQPFIPADSIVQLVRADNDTAWVLSTETTATGIILYGTTDGGNMWQSFNPPTSACVVSPPRLGFFDARHLWLACSGGGATIQERRVIARSDDGGAIWRTTFDAVVSGHLASLAVSDRDVAFIGECRNTAEVTRDGGTTWTSTVADNATAVPLGGCVSPVVFLDSQHGWAGGQAADQHPLVWRTDDGGTTWSPVDLP